MTLLKKKAVCNICTLKLINLAYQRAPLFRLVREPLKGGMRGLAWMHRIDLAEYEVRTPACYGCIRFYKTALKDKSALFRRLNRLVNPLFDALLEQLVTGAEIRQAKAYAQAATVGAVSPEQALE
ncbi:MAG: nitroreductase [Chloroflexota bacterium]